MQRLAALARAELCKPPKACQRWSPNSRFRCVAATRNGWPGASWDPNSQKGKGGAKGGVVSCFRLWAGTPVNKKWAPAEPAGAETAQVLLVRLHYLISISGPIRLLGHAGQDCQARLAGDWCHHWVRRSSCRFLLDSLMRTFFGSSSWRIFHVDTISGFGCAHKLPSCDSSARAASWQGHKAFNSPLEKADSASE